LREYDQPKSVNIVVDSEYFREKPEGLNIHWKPQFEIWNFLCIAHTHADFGRNALREDISAIFQDGDGSTLSRDIRIALIYHGDFKCTPHFPVLADLSRNRLSLIEICCRADHQGLKN
jgi:hypothetical protein